MSTAAPERPGTVEQVLAPLMPREPEQRRALRREVIRVLVVMNLVLGTWYLAWRWTNSVHWSSWIIAVPLVLAETYSFADSWLFGLTMWRVRERGAAPPPPAGATVDVMITCYDEPVELVRVTARAARAIAFPHTTFILDDGASPAMAAMAREEGIGYVTRSADWQDRPRHAKAGNLNNALFQTQGEFLLILDADQIPHPEILDKTLGWFTDDQVALVQTPQWFVNVSDDDPMGSQAPLFYGPIQQGKDGWNAAFFCGSNAVLRREALMQLGITGYVRDTERAIWRVLKTADKVLGRARTAARRRGDAAAVAALDALGGAIGRLRAGLDDGLTTQEVTHAFRGEVDVISRGLVRRDMDALHADLAELDLDAFDLDVETGGLLVDEEALDRLATRELSPLGALESVRGLLDDLDAVQADEAQPVMPMATISVTEDMATAMRMHGMGWRSVYHHEILAEGLAPEDLASMLKQRLRWAQGTLQVLMRESPLTTEGLSPGQRVMYLMTMWSYLSGFAAVVYIAAPILYLVFDVTPVKAFGAEFAWHLVPALLANQALFLVVGWKLRTWRGQQYSLALFPLWITACSSAVANVAFGRKLGFVVTPKTKQEQTKVPFKLIRVQLAAMALLVLAAVVGLVRLMVGDTTDGGAVMLNVGWVVYDLVSLSVVVDAAFHRGFEAPDAEVA